MGLGSINTSPEGSRYLPVPSTSRIWHKVFLLREFCRGVGQCWSYDHLVEYELCQPLLSLPARKPGDLAGHWFTKPYGFVKCESMFGFDWPPGTYTGWGRARPEQLKAVRPLPNCHSPRGKMNLTTEVRTHYLQCDSSVR